MIRILHIVTYMGRGGLETMIMNFYRNVDRSKIQFDFLTHRDFKADYDDEIEAMGGRIYRISRLVPWSSAYKSQLNAFFAEHPEYKIIHVHQDCMSSVILKEAVSHNIPVRIAHSHSSSQDKDLKYPIKLFYRKKISKYATDLFACSNEAGNWMFCGAPYKVINNAIDIERYIFSVEKSISVRKAFDIPDDAFVIAHTGRFAPTKNHTFLVDVFNEILSVNENSRLLLIGDGDLRERIQEKVKQLGISEKVIFAGLRTDVNELLQAANVYIMPSIYEGLPVSLLEAQASGLPCIISDHFSKDCNITNAINRLSLNDSARKWAELACGFIGKPRLETADDIKNAGFDIKENAAWLQEYYIKQWDAHN